MFGWFNRTREPVDRNQWKCQFLDLAGTEFWAVVGPWGSGRPAFYSVAVERKCPDGSYATLFSAKYAVAGLPRGFCSRPIGEVVRFDSSLGVVEFDLGGQAAWCRLPDGSEGQPADHAEPYVAADHAKAECGH
jgi:hypothetical protein